MIGVAGLSHLGIVSSIVMASKGVEVLAYDPDASLCQRLHRGDLPISEPQLAELLAKSRSCVRFTDNASALGSCPLVICSADVPTDSADRSDLSPIRRFIEIIHAHASPETVLVVLSQVPPGFSRVLDEDMRRASPGMRLFYQVETLVIGCAVERALRPERFIVGCRDPRDPLPPLYAQLLSRFACPILTMRYESAELAKIAVNMFLASSVCTTNTLAECCEAIGADWSEMIPALTSDKRIGPHAYLKPGLGLSGGNLERDLATLRSLARALNTDAGMVDAWFANSRHRRDWVLKTLQAEVLAGCHDPVIAVWGLAYKPETSSTKNSPALSLLEALDAATVRAYDPQARLDPGQFAHVSQVASAHEACQGADALVIMTPWPEFSSVSDEQVRALMRGRVILDPFGAFDGDRCAASGFRYLRLGALAQGTRCGSASTILGSAA